jgi:glycolate oxidase FAD binding subunit
MADTYRPDSAEQLRELVAWACAEEAPLEVLGRGSKRGVGRPMQAQAGVDMTGFTGIIEYEPDELILAAHAGTPLADIQAELAAKAQDFAFEPPDLGPLLGGGAGQATIGGTVSCNLAGPRRVKSGAVRDHFLGFHAVSGRGEAFKSGGRVVKNVTGYDLCKLMCGAYGTLAVMTDVTLKVLPVAEETRTVLLVGLDEDAAVKALTAGLQSAYEVSAAAHLPADVARASGVSTVKESGGAVTALRIEGPPVSVKHRAKKLAEEVLHGHGETHELQDRTSREFWAEVRDVRPFVGLDGMAVWRISVPPAEGAGVARRLGEAVSGARYYLDWGGGLIWLAVPQGKDAQHASVRASLGTAGGHATLIKADPEFRAAVPVFQPQANGVGVLTKNLKDAFDPRRVLNPGRMYAGI